MRKAIFGIIVAGVMLGAADYIINPYARNYSSNYVYDEAEYRAGGSYTTIAGGELEVTATVSVIYTY